MWYSISEDNPQSEWDKMAELMMLKFAESGHPVFRASLLSRGQLTSTKAVENCRYTSVPMGRRLKLFHRTIISVNQLSLHGAVAQICEEYETFHDGTVKPVVGRQSLFVPNMIKTDVPLESVDGARKDLPLQQYGERMENYHNKKDQVNFVWMLDF